MKISERTVKRLGEIITGDKASVFADALDGPQLAVRNFQLVGWRELRHTLRHTQNIDSGK